MKKTFLILSLIGAPCYATSIESLFGSITQHFDSGGSDHFRTKLNKSGTLIFNPMYGVKVFNEHEIMYTSITGFVGNNSVGRLMVGGTYSLGAKVLSDHVMLGGVVGMYGQSDSGFRKSGVIINNTPKIGDTSLIPIVGAELNFKLKLTDEVYIKQNNIVTPMLYNANLSLGIQY